MDPVLWDLDNYLYRTTPDVDEDLQDEEFKTLVEEGNNLHREEEDMLWNLLRREPQ